MAKSPGPRVAFRTSNSYSMTIKCGRSPFRAAPIALRHRMAKTSSIWKRTFASRSTSATLDLGPGSRLLCEPGLKAIEYGCSSPHQLRSAASSIMILPVAPNSDCGGLCRWRTIHRREEDLRDAGCSEVADGFLGWSIPAPCKGTTDGRPSEPGAVFAGGGSVRGECNDRHQRALSGLLLLSRSSPRHGAIDGQRHRQRAALARSVAPLNEQGGRNVMGSDAMFGGSMMWARG